MRLLLKRGFKSLGFFLVFANKPIVNISKQREVLWLRLLMFLTCNTWYMTQDTSQMTHDKKTMNFISFFLIIFFFFFFLYGCYYPHTFRVSVPYEWFSLHQLQGRYSLEVTMSVCVSVLLPVNFEYAITVRFSVKKYMVSVFLINT